MSEKTESPNYITWEEHQRSMRYLEEDVRNLRRRIRLLVRILVDKKIVGEQLAKSVEETLGKEFAEENKTVLDWYNEQLEAEKTNK